MRTLDPRGGHRDPKPARPHGLSTRMATPVAPRNRRRGQGRRVWCGCAPVTPALRVAHALTSAPSRGGRRCGTATTMQVGARTHVARARWISLTRSANRGTRARRRCFMRLTAPWHRRSIKTLARECARHVSRETMRGSDAAWRTAATGPHHAAPPRVRAPPANAKTLRSGAHNREPGRWAVPQRRSPAG